MNNEKWYQDPHVWAMILADVISVLGIVTKYLPPKEAAIVIAVSHSLFGIDQMITGAIQNISQQQQSPSQINIPSTNAQVVQPSASPSALPPNIEL
jgi:hypothetical protein